MPKVPTSAPGPRPVDLPPPPDETSLAMAAAMMHAEGRLFEPGAYSVSRAAGEDFDAASKEASRLAKEGKVAPLSRQYNSKTGVEGPLNINPYPLRAE